MAQKILVINPNSTDAVTDAIDRSVAGLRFAGGPEVECVTLAEGPPGIETDAHVAQVVEPLCRLAAARQDADAFVVACFSDPGLGALRAGQGKPAYGISECAMLTALSLGGRFGILSILDQSIPRHVRYVAELGLSGRLAGDLAIGFGVTELEAAEGVFARMVEVGVELRDRHGAGSLILGCAGMADYRARLEEAVGLPVIEPCQAAVAMALGRLRLAA